MFFNLSLVKTSVLFLSAYSIVSVALAEKHEKEADQSIRSKTPSGLEYISVFDDYLPFDEYPDIGWKEANDRVGEIGGWRAYAKLVQEEAKKKAEQEKQQMGDDEQ